jgi:hypothetical protein
MKSVKYVCASSSRKLDGELDESTVWFEFNQVAHLIGMSLWLSRSVRRCARPGGALRRDEHAGGANPALAAHGRHGHAMSPQLVAKLLQQAGATGDIEPAKDVRSSERCKCMLSHRAVVAAALQFVVRRPAIPTIIPGVRSVAQLDENLRTFKAAIQPEFWFELRRREVIRADAPTPCVSYPMLSLLACCKKINCCWREAWSDRQGRWFCSDFGVRHVSESLQQSESQRRLHEQAPHCE